MSSDNARYRQCRICSQLKEYEHGFQKGGQEAEDTYIHQASNELKLVKMVDNEWYWRDTQLQQCPECKTMYIYRHSYEFLVYGSEDEQELMRLTDEEANKYLEKPGK